MNRKVGAVVGVVMGVVVVGIVAISGISAGSSNGVEPTASAVAAASPVATARPTAKPTPVATVRPTAQPTPVATIEPSAAPTAVAPTSSPTAPTSEVASTVRLPKLTAKVPGATKIKYFGVDGDSPFDLLSSVIQRSKAGCKSDDTLACVSQQPNVRWTNRTVLATGACTVVATQSNLKSIVHLPRWERPTRVQPALLKWWKETSSHLTWHEGQHIKIQKSYDAKLDKLMVGHACSSANKTYKTWLRSLRAAQRKFDAKDHQQWSYPEYTEPGGWYGI